MAAIEDIGSVAEQAAADVAQVIRGKEWLQRVVEVAEAVTDAPPAEPEPRVARTDPDRRAS